MKRIILLLIVIFILISMLFGCVDKKIEESTEWVKYDLEEFKTILNNHIKANGNEDDFSDITPYDVFEETGAQIFKNGKTCESYLLYDATLYTLGIGFGGFGITDIVTGDFNNDGNRELVYTYSWGSGIHRSCFGCFDLSSKEEITIEVHGTELLGFIEDDLILEKKSDTLVEVYTASVTIDDGNFAKLSFEKNKLFGEIKEVKNKPVLFINHILEDE